MRIFELSNSTASIALNTCELLVSDSIEASWFCAWNGEYSFRSNPSISLLARYAIPSSSGFLYTFIAVSVSTGIVSV